MERSFQDAILREDRSRKNWVAAWGGLQKEADDTRAVSHPCSPSPHHTSCLPSCPLSVSGSLRSRLAASLPAALCCYVGIGVAQGAD
jgi:hypothetical protein